MADDEKILGIKKSELTELVRQILAEMPTSLPANGGNADYATNAGNAETLSEWGRVPTLDLDNVDLGFIAASGEANSAPNTFWSTVLTVGQGVQSYAAQLAFPWLYDPSQAMKYRVLSNGIWYDWKEIYTSGNKPYIVGDVSVKAGELTAITNHNFMPSAVFWWENKSSVYPATSFDTTSFNMAVASSIDRTINCIIFK